MPDALGVAIRHVTPTARASSAMTRLESSIAGIYPLPAAPVECMTDQNSDSGSRFQFRHLNRKTTIRQHRKSAIYLHGNQPNCRCSDSLIWPIALTRSVQAARCGAGAQHRPSHITPVDYAFAVQVIVSVLFHNETFKTRFRHPRFKWHSCYFSVSSEVTFTVTIHLLMRHRCSCPLHDRASRLSVPNSPNKIAP